jgi:FkbM family methyltransferase
LRPDGLKIAADAVGVSTVAVVFVKDDYGRAVDGPAVIDIGANIGAFTLLAARTAGTRVFAYEPVSSTFAQLQRNIERNGLGDRVTAYRLGVTGAAEERRIALSPHGSPFNSLYGATADGDAAETVRTTTLADVFADNDLDFCDTLKLDCEGAEFEILYAAPADVLSRIGMILLEYHEQDRPGHRWADLSAHLRRHGFRVEREGPRIANTGTVSLRRMA